MKSKTKHIIQLIRQNVNSIDPSAEVILYGSRARGDDHANSDWDVLVLTEYGVDLNIERKFRNNLYNLELETGEPFSIFVYSKYDWQTKQKITPFYYNVTREGLLIWLSVKKKSISDID